MFRYYTSINHRGGLVEIGEVMEERRANKPTRIQRKSPNFGDHPGVDNNSKKRGRNKE